jgi:hypothetical protein
MMKLQAQSKIVFCSAGVPPAGFLLVKIRKTAGGTPAPPTPAFQLKFAKNIPTMGHPAKAEG